MTHGTLNLLSRYGIVGILATFIYLVVANALMLSGTAAPTASVLGYLAGMIASFLGQSRFTFRVGRARWNHVFRFVVLSTLGLLVSYWSVAVAIPALHIASIWGTIATALLVPTLSFVVMRYWVFTPSRRSKYYESV